MQFGRPQRLSGRKELSIEYNGSVEEFCVLRGITMPVHDWTRVPAGVFHHFHHCWIDENARALNRGLQGSDYYALAEQVAGGWAPDVLTLQDLSALPSAQQAVAKGE